MNLLWGNYTPRYMTSMHNDLNINLLYSNIHNIKHKPLASSVVKLLSQAFFLFTLYITITVALFTGYSGTYWHSVSTLQN
jgi:hypothetical protein